MPRARCRFALRGGEGDHHGDRGTAGDPCAFDGRRVAACVAGAHMVGAAGGVDAAGGARAMDLASAAARPESWGSADAVRVARARAFIGGRRRRVCRDAGGHGSGGRGGALGARIFRRRCEAGRGTRGAPRRRCRSKSLGGGVDRRRVAGALDFTRPCGGDRRAARARDPAARTPRTTARRLACAPTRT